MSGMWTRVNTTDSPCGTPADEPMSTEEAQMRIKELFDMYVENEPLSEHYLYSEAVRMAIGALEDNIH